MTKLYRIFKTQLLLAVVLFGTSIGIAQNPVVEVPSYCKVVEIGVGGNVAIAANPTANPPIVAVPGRVGRGGKITMPDPPPTTLGIFTIIPKNTVSPAPVVTNTVGTWLLSGDLSSTTLATNLYGAPVQIIGTPLSAVIKSYNKFLRTSEGTSPSVNSWARSKGRVTIQFTQTTSTTGSGCGNSITFDVFKVFAPTVLLNPANINIQPTNIPKIIGPKCVLPNKTYTYSVDQIVSDNLTDGIGLDSYYWTGMPTSAGTTFYTSADKSSITIKTGPTVSNFTLKCCFGRSNPWDGDGTGVPTTCVS